MISDWQPGGVAACQPLTDHLPTTSLSEKNAVDYSLKALNGTKFNVDYGTYITFSWKLHLGNVIKIQVIIRHATNYRSP